MTDSTDHPATPGILAQLTPEVRELIGAELAAKLRARYLSAACSEDERLGEFRSADLIEKWTSR